MSNRKLPRRRLIRLSRRFVDCMNQVAPLFGRARIQDITTEELRILRTKNEKSFVLVDVRSAAEREVSTIPGSISQANFLARRNELTGRLIVAFCTVGGRSLLFAQRCVREGFESRNYSAGILGWCAAGELLIDSNGVPTRRVHTHSRLFDVPEGYVRVC